MVFRGCEHRTFAPGVGAVLLFWAALFWVSVGALGQADRGTQVQASETFQSAAAHFDAQHYAEAEKELLPLAKKLPQSFEVNELLGLVYAAEGEDAAATPYLERAVRLKPSSGAAHTNLATNLARLGKNAPAEAEFKRAVALEPASYDANHNLGEFYVHGHEVAKAIAYLERAEQSGSSYENGYDLALAEVETGDYARARSAIQGLLRQRDTAELHNLLAEADEKLGDFVAAEQQYERAAHLDPSESNIFDWGSDLLLHQTLEPAETVFRQGLERYPRSVRMEIGLGIALYARGQYDDAVKAFSAATDLSPSDPRPYQFLAKAYGLAPTQADAVTARLRRFSELEPRNAQARYDYAMSLWKGQREQDRSPDLEKIESLLKESIALDPHFADACLELGILYAAERQYADAIGAYRRAIQIQPDLVDAHYRLAQALVRTGERDEAQKEFARHEQLHRQEMAQADQSRSEIKQFVFTMQKAPQAGKPTSLDIGPSAQPGLGSVGFDDRPEFKPGPVNQSTESGGYSAAAYTDSYDLILSLAASAPPAASRPSHAADATDNSPLAPDATESEYFARGRDLLVERRLAEAADVLTAGVARFPDSAQLQMGLGVADYARGRYDDAVKALTRSTDLAPSDPRAYQLLGEAYNVSKSESGEVAKRLERWVQIEPQNALACYYDALSLWKGRQATHADSARIESLLRRASELDPRLADAPLELGNLYASEGRDEEAITQYRKAIQLKPDLAAAHYRLSQVLLRSGDKAEAAVETATYERLHQEHPRR